MWKAKNNRIIERLYSPAIPEHYVNNVIFPCQPAFYVLKLPNLPAEKDPIKKSVLTQEQLTYLQLTITAISVFGHYLGKETKQKTIEVLSSITML